MTSVFDQDRSIIFCKDLTFARSSSLTALKILRRSRPTLSSCSRQLMASHSKVTSSVPFTVMVSNLSLGSGVSGASSAKAHPPHVSLLSQPGTRPGIRPVIRRAPGWRTGHTLPLSRCLSATGIRFLGVLFPPGNPAFLTVGLPAAPRRRYQTLTGFPRSARMRCGRAGCPLYPGGDGVPATIGASAVAVCRLTTAGPCHPGTASRPGMSD